MTTDNPSEPSGPVPVVQEPSHGLQSLHYRRSPSPSLTPPDPSPLSDLNGRSGFGASILSSSGVRGQTPPFPASPTFFLHNSHPLDSSASPSPTAPLDTPPGLSYGEYIRTWTDAHVARWLNEIRCSSYASVFKENDIRGDILLDLDNMTLREMGITSIGDRLRIVNGVKNLRQRASGHGRSPTPETREPQPKRQGSGPTPTSSTSSPLSNDRADRFRPSSPKGTFEDIPSPSPPHGGDSTLSQDHRHLNSTDSDDSSSARRFTSRPAPLQLDSDEKTGASSGARTGGSLSSHPPSTGVRPLPQPVTAGTSSSVPSSVHTRDNSANRTGLPPLPPVPKTQPPAPPSKPTTSRHPYTPNSRTPDTIPTPSTGFNQPFLGANSQIPHVSGSPPTNGSLPQDNRKPPGPRSPSPLTLTRNPPPRSSSTHVPIVTTSTAQLNHRKAASQATNLSDSHVLTQSPKMALRPPPVTANPGLSPIVEAFAAPNNSHGRSTATPSLNDLRKKHIKFLVPDKDFLSHSITIDVTSCSSGYEVLEKALKKLGRGNSGSLASPLSPASGSPMLGEISPSAATFTPEGGLLVDGWAAYFPVEGDDSAEVLPDQSPLTDVEITSFCHAPPSNPIREKGLVLKRNSNALSRWDGPSFSPSKENNESHAFNFSSRSPVLSRRNTKRASAISVLSGLGVPDPERAWESVVEGFDSGLSYLPHRSPPPIPEASPSSSLGGFNVVVPSPTADEDLDSSVSPPLELPATAALPGNRPPSELITNNLQEFFPFTEKKVLDRTSKARSRQSLMKRGTMMSMLSTTSSEGDDGAAPRESILAGLIPPVPPVPPPPVPTSVTFQGPVADRSSKRKSVMVSGPPRLSMQPNLTFAGGADLDHDSKRRKRATRVINPTVPQAPLAAGALDDITVDVISADVQNKRLSAQVAGGSNAPAGDDDEWTRVNESGEEESKSADISEEEEEEEEEEETFKWIKGALIGSGSFGKVYLGMDAASGFLMAVKQIERPEEGASSAMLASLEREIDLLRDLQHEKIVQYFHSSMDDEYLNIFLEYVPGGSVTALLRSYGAFEEPLVKNFVRQILEGLNYLHEKGIIHRDIKGGNVLVDNKGGIKISDFGVSKKVDSGTLMPGRGGKNNRLSLQGSVFWMAPEVVKQTVHTKKADIWSLGCLIVEMLTGEHPWGNLSQMQAIFKIGSGTAKPDIPSDISADAQDFLQKTFELDYTVRPGASELLTHPWVALKKQPSFFRRGPTFS